MLKKWNMYRGCGYCIPSVGILIEKVGRAGLPYTKTGVPRNVDRVIWLYSRKRSFVVGCGVQRIPGEVIRVCKRRIRLRVKLPDREKLVNVSPENVLFNEDE